MNHIIIPIDFSNESLFGLDLAIMLSKKMPSKLQMVYVQKKSADYSPGTKEEEYNFAENNFKKIKEKYSKKLYNGSTLSYIIKTGRIYREVVHQAESFKKSFIVTSTHGASGFEKFFIGSNTFKIISATTKPVFSIRHTKPPARIRRIVLPLDITVDTRQKIPFTAEVAAAFNAVVHVVGVSSSQSDEIKRKLSMYINQTAEYLKKHEIECKTDFITGSNITDITIDYAHEHHADLISMMTEQPHNVSNFVLGNYAQQMLNKADIPVLSISPKELHVAGNFTTQG